VDSGLWQGRFQRFWSATGQLGAAFRCRLVLVNNLNPRPWSNVLGDFVDA
jgi:hypothetical protein